MRGEMRVVLAALVVCGALIAPRSASATGILEKDKDKSANCNKGSYPRLTYWIPRLRRLKYCFYPPPIEEAYFSDRYSDIPPSYKIQKFPCPYAEPAALYNDRQSPDEDKETKPEEHQEAKP